MDKRHSLPPNTAASKEVDFTLDLIVSALGGLADRVSRGEISSEMAGEVAVSMAYATVDKMVTRLEREEQAEQAPDYQEE